MASPTAHTTTPLQYQKQYRRPQYSKRQRITSNITYKSPDHKHRVRREHALARSVAGQHFPQLTGDAATSATVVQLQRNTVLYCICSTNSQLRTAAVAVQATQYCPSTDAVAVAVSPFAHACGQMASGQYGTPSAQTHS